MVSIFFDFEVLRKIGPVTSDFGPKISASPKTCLYSLNF